MNFITERDGKGTITMTPKNEAEQSALLVICHGLGDTSDGFDDVAEVRRIAVVVVDDDVWLLRVNSSHTSSTTLLLTTTLLHH